MADSLEKSLISILTQWWVSVQCRARYGSSTPFGGFVMGPRYNKKWYCTHRTSSAVSHGKITYFLSSKWTLSSISSIPECLLPQDVVLGFEKAHTLGDYNLTLLFCMKSHWNAFSSALSVTRMSTILTAMHRDTF